MKTQLANKQLEDFLKKEGVLTKWLKNAKKSYGCELFKLALEDRNQELSASFIFEETPEGHDFWQKLNDKYESLINE